MCTDLVIFDELVPSFEECTIAVPGTDVPMVGLVHSNYDENVVWPGAGRCVDSVSSGVDTIKGWTVIGYGSL